MSLGKFTTVFDEVFAENGMRVIKTPVRSPRANSYADRFVGKLRRECLDHVLILGENHLRKVPRIERKPVVAGLISEYCTAA